MDGRDGGGTHYQEIYYKRGVRLSTETEAEAWVESLGPRIEATPNPFHSRVMISYTLPATSSSRLAIYDSAGRLVRFVTAGVQEAGDYQVPWDGRNDRGESLAAAVYFARLEATGTEGSVKRLVLLP
jgi:hypothetical protein